MIRVTERHVEVGRKSVKIEFSQEFATPLEMRPLSLILGKRKIVVGAEGLEPPTFSV
jgi:hypothetical protein